MNGRSGLENPWGASFAGQVTYYPTNETYGVGPPGSTTHASLSLEGNNRGVESNPDRFWALFEFDLPTKLPLGEQKWTLPFDCTELQVRLLPKVRGEELWSSLNTTTLPEFTRVRIKAAPTFTPAKIQSVAKTVLENIDLLLMAVDRPTLPLSARDGLSLRASFYLRPGRDKQVLTATVPLTGEISYDSPSPVPVTTKVQNRLDLLRGELITFVSPKPRTERFLEQVRHIVHDFSYYGRQHPDSLGGLTEPVLRDLLLVVLKHFFPAEGEAYHRSGKSDIKVVNPENRYEFAIVELKVWRGRDSIEELLTQAFEKHATGQEALVVCQILSRNTDFIAVADQVRDLVDDHPQTIGQLSRVRYEGSREVLYESLVRIRENDVPLLVSCINLHGNSAY